MTDIVVNSSDSNEDLKKKAEAALGGDVRLTEQSGGGGRRLKLDREQTDRLNRMSVEARRAALGGDVKQMLND